VHDGGLKSYIVGAVESCENRDEEAKARQGAVVSATHGGE